MTEFLETAGGRIAYDVTGQGPLLSLFLNHPECV